MRTRLVRWLVGIALIVGLAAGPAPRAQAGQLTAGVSDLVNGVFALPVGILAGTIRGPLVLGTVAGALTGAFNTLGYAARGVLRVTGAAIPIAAKAAPLIPLFL